MLRLSNARCRTALTLLSLVAPVLAGCGGASSDDPALKPLTCRDGYVVHPQSTGPDGSPESCAKHGGVVDQVLDPALEQINKLPSTPPNSYICADGTASYAVGEQGACSHHGGVAILKWDDGTEFHIQGR